MPTEAFTADGGVTALASERVLASTGDVSIARETARQSRLKRLTVCLAAVAVWVAVHLALGNPTTAGLPHLPHIGSQYMTAIALLVVMGAMVVGPMVGLGRSPHITFRSSDLQMSLDDVRGAAELKTEVVNTLNLFLGFKTFSERLGGTPRRAILFEGPPGTGKTHMAKAMAAEAGVPFLFVSSSSFQSMYYGQTNRKVRAYFKALRKAARREGGAIGFIEEFDAIGGARSGMGSSSSREGVTGVVNELLVQLQSFDEPTRSERIVSAVSSTVNRMLPATRQLPRRRPSRANILVVGATNRAADLDPALLRPGRFDRSIFFGLPGRADRADILAYYVARKAHTAELDDRAEIDRLAGATMGYSPVMLENLLDEALVMALRRGAQAMTSADVTAAKLSIELGLTTPAAYTEAERRTIATHEAGHATVAYFAGVARNLEVLSILKRKAALGLLAHSETEERFTRTRTEIKALMAIAMGGLVAEERYFGEAGSGPSGDLQAATTAAAQMVGSLGMGGSLISYEAAAMPGNANVVAKVLSFEEGRAAVESLLEEAKLTAARLVAEHCDVVEALRDALLARDELVGTEITEVITAAVARHPRATLPA